jgi:hypothetical protein
MPLSSLPATAWHDKPTLTQLFGNECGHDFLDIPAHCGNNPNATILQLNLQSLGDSGANQRLSAQLSELANALLNGALKSVFLPANYLAIG